MENTQLSLLNALFGGKLAGDALAGLKPENTPKSDQESGQGFFSFLESLLTAKPGSDDESVNVQPAPPKPLNAFNAEELRKMLKDDAAPESVIAIPAEAIADPLKPNFTEAPRAELAAVQPQPDAPQPAAATSIAPVAPVPATAAEPALAPASVEVVETGVVSKTVISAQPAGAIGSVLLMANGQRGEVKAETVTPRAPAVPLEKTAPGFVDPVNEFHASEGESRFDSPPLRSDIKAPTPTVKPTPPGAAAIADHAAPEALSHSALTRDEAAAMDADRMTTHRLELATNAADRNMHINPVRDQVIAAVAARQGEGKLEIRLDPPELGRVLIGFERDGSDIVRAVISADSPETLDLMRRNADVFQRALEAQGFDNLNLHFADKGLQGNADGQDGETFKNVHLVEDETMAGLPAPSPQIADGRLDRRL